MRSTQTNQCDLFATVVASGCCIGCGVCAVFDASIKIKLDPEGRYVAVPESTDATSNAAATRVCPFADGVPNEDDLAREVFGGEKSMDSRVGHHLATYAGWVAESDFRTHGSSGGLASWLLVELLEQGHIDYVVHVAPESSPSSGGPLFRFAASGTPEEVRARAKSRYYPVEMSEVLAEVLRRPGRYAIVGVPCFIKAIRLACRESALLRERVVFTVGIVCGHLKSTAFAELLAWQCGVSPTDLRSIDFRAKIPELPAHSYAVEVSGDRHGNRFSVRRPTSQLYGSNWGHGLFKYKACDFCDDVVGETADISIGDAWLPEYVSDSRGTNIMVVRSPVLNSILSNAAAAQRLHLDRISVEKVVESQAGGFRHRREGLAYRLFLEDEAGRWHPRKRVVACGRDLTPRLRQIYALRYELGQSSHAAFAQARAQQDLVVFMKAMKPLTDRYDLFYRRPLVHRLFSKVKRALAWLFRG